ncbi:MAG: multiheme c-type cytochrome, partial [Candidatus Kapaibacterium sp.]
MDSSTDMVRAGLRNLLLLLVGAWLVSCDRPEAPEPLSPSRADSVAIYTKAFSPPESCATCHPRQYREWELSMHAYAIEDPVFHSMNAEG